MLRRSTTFSVLVAVAALTIAVVKFGPQTAYETTQSTDTRSVESAIPVGTTGTQPKDNKVDLTPDEEKSAMHVAKKNEADRKDDLNSGRPPEPHENTASASVEAADDIPKSDRTPQSHEDISKIFFSFGSCITSECVRTEELAREIIDEPSTVGDSWAHSTEHELLSRVKEEIAADKRAKTERIEGMVACSVRGCIAYIEGNYSYTNYAASIADRMRGDESLVTLTQNGTWPSRYLFRDAHLNGKQCQLIVYPR